MNQNRKEFDSIYRAYAIQIYRYLLSIGCPAQDAEDIVQETFVKALRKIDSFRGECKLLVWLCQIAKNGWYEQLKREKRKVPMHPLTEDTSYQPMVELLDMVYRLDEPYRTVFLKIAICGWDYEDLARQYGKSVSWSRVTYYRARMKLQEALKDGRM